MKWGFVLTFLLLSSKVQCKDILSVYVFEISPLIYQNEKKEIKGVWYEGFEKLSEISDIKFVYQFVSIPRMELMLAGNRPGCNLTLLKTQARIKKGVNFIYDHPVKTVFKSYYRSNDLRKWTLNSLQEDKHIKIITNTSVGVDALKEKGIGAELLFNINSIVHMLLMKRVDLVVASNLAIEKMPEFRNKEISSGVIVKSMPHGIGCSHATPKHIIEKLQKSTRKWTLPN